MKEGWVIHPSCFLSTGSLAAPIKSPNAWMFWPRKCDGLPRGGHCKRHRTEHERDLSTSLLTAEKGRVQQEQNGWETIMQSSTVAHWAQITNNGREFRYDVHDGFGFKNNKIHRGTCVYTSLRITNSRRSHIQMFRLFTSWERDNGTLFCEVKLLAFFYTT